MFQPAASVHLLNVKAELLAVSREEWSSALELALSRGWKPERTGRPPVTLDGGQETTWDGRHTPACGQEMRAGDARNMSQCLKAAVASGGKYPEAIRKLADYAEKGGFLICETVAPQTTGLMNLARALGTGLGVPASARRSAEQISAAPEPARVSRV